MRCAKEKSFLIRELAKLYLDRAQEASETIKVGYMMLPTSGKSVLIVRLTGCREYSDRGSEEGKGLPMNEFAMTIMWRSFVGVVTLLMTRKIYTTSFMDSDCITTKRKVT